MKNYLIIALLISTCFAQFLYSQQNTLFTVNISKRLKDLLTKEGQKFHDHKQMITEINGFLQNLKTTNAWDTESAVNTVKSILDHYMGAPPKDFPYLRINYTPKEFLANYLQLNPDNYVDIMSLKEKPYFKQIEYEVTDNGGNKHRSYE